MKLFKILVNGQKFISDHLQILYKTLVKYRVASVGKNLHVNGFSIVSKTTILGNNVNFNGIRISGAGKVQIGNSTFAFGF